MRTKEEKELLRQKAKANLKKDFISNTISDKKKPSPKKFGGGGFGRGC